MANTSEAQAAHVADRQGHWSAEAVLARAQGEGLALSEDHWDAINLLRRYFLKQGQNADAQEVLCRLEEEFGRRAGRKYLVQLFPCGVIEQGCRIAGIPVFTRALGRGRFALLAAALTELEELLPLLGRRENAKVGNVRGLAGGAR